MNVIAYRRVSTDKQGESGLGLEAQTAAVEAYCEQHGHTIVQWYEDVASGGRADREGFQLAMDSLRLCARDVVGGLIVAKVDRMTRSLGQFAQIMDTSRKQGWELIALDLGVDTTTAAGKAMASLLAVFAQFERDMASERTKAAIARRRENLGGTLPGTRPAVPSSLRTRLARMREQGMTFRAIAARLEAEKVPTAQGGVWRPGTVKHILGGAA